MSDSHNLIALYAVVPAFLASVATYMDIMCVSIVLLAEYKVASHIFWLIENQTLTM